MKKFSIFTLGALLIVTACTNTKKSDQKNGEDNHSVASEILVNTQLKFNESTLPYKGGVLVANFGSDQLNPLNTDGKGFILNYKDDVLMPFIAAKGELNAPKGMFERNGMLYVADVNKIAVFNLKDTAAQALTIKFPKEDLFVNDLAADGNSLYASVTNTGNIYKIDISDISKLDTQEPVLFANVVGANGLLIENGVMYVASYPADGLTTEKNVIYSIKDLKNPIPEPFITVPGQYDGLALSFDKKTM